MNPWLKTAATFAIGLLLGVAGTGYYIHHCFSRAWINSGNHQHAVEHLTSKLKLTSDQKTQVEKIFDEEAPNLDKIRQGTNTQLKTVRDKTSARIRLVLAPDQQKNFDELKKKWDAHHDQNDKGWHIPGLPLGSLFGFGASTTPSLTPSSK
jgi:Spy/CpxP family protein refolding chaperone